jgi:hypothetical protein
MGEHVDALERRIFEDALRGMPVPQAPVDAVRTGTRVMMSRRRMRRVSIVVASVVIMLFAGIVVAPRGVLAALREVFVPFERSSLIESGRRL